MSLKDNWIKTLEKLSEEIAEDICNQSETANDVTAVAQLLDVRFKEFIKTQFLIFQVRKQKDNEVIVAAI